MIEFIYDVSQATKEFITTCLPKKNTVVVEVCESKLQNINARLHTESDNVEEIKSWIKEFEDITKATYSSRSTVNSAGRYVRFKQILNCQHNTQSNEMYDISKKSRTKTKNTNCPSTITVTLHAIKKRYQGKNEKLHVLRKKMPCEISVVFTHNHNLESADALKHRRVTDEVREKLLKLFCKGHSPATALETLKSDIYLHTDNPQFILADRSKCPDYMYCYHLYIKQFKEQYGPLDFTAVARDFLQKRLDEYNAETDNNSTQIIFHETEYIICICPPLMKRVHKYVQSASEIVFMDSSGTVDHDGSRIFVILTHSECGGLPLAVIITSCESSEIIKKGFQLLKSMLGEEIFGGNPEGPKIFVTDDSQAEQTAIRDMWKNSQCYLCIFHVLQSAWRWLNKATNNIPQEHRSIYFDYFKTILYSRTINGALQQFEMAISNASSNPNFIVYLESYWQRKEQWVLAYRNNSISKGHNTNNLSEAVMKVIKEKIFHQVKAFNIVQMVDFILTRFVQYYEVRLLEAANNRLRKNIFGKMIKIPPVELLGKIQILSTSTVLVPSESTEQVHYIVNLDALRCSCFQGTTGKLCKHIDWACMLLYSEEYNMRIDSIESRKKFYLIATGEEPPSNWLLPLWSKNETTVNPVTHFSSESYDPQSENHNFQLDAHCLQSREETAEEYLQRGQRAIEKLNSSFGEHLQNNPTRSVVEALEKMCQSAEKLHTTSSFVSACQTFGLEYRRRNRNAKIPVQPTAVSRRKSNISGRSSHVGGRPRHTIKKKAIRKKTQHSLSKRVVNKMLPFIELSNVEHAGTSSSGHIF